MSDFPIRCFTCGKVIGRYIEKYTELIPKFTPKEALDKLNIKKYCCRMVFLGYVNYLEKVIISTK